MLASAAVGALAILAVTQFSRSQSSTAPVALPSQAVYIDPLQYAVLGPDSNLWRTNDSETTYFNPTNATPPFFQVYDPSFVTDILGENATFYRIASQSGYAFAHEAPIWVQETDEVFFSSNDGGPLGYSDWYNNSVVGKINLADVEQAISQVSGYEVSVPFAELNLSDTVQMTNGGTGPYYGNLILATSGRALLPPSLALVNPYPPYNVTVILDNFFGRQFNSLNDVKVHRQSGAIFFTDTTYGWLNGFRPEPQLPNQVYRLDPQTGSVRVVADGFVRNNGVAFSPEGDVAYVSDTGISGGFLGTNYTLPATIYSYDIDSSSGAFTNRRVFAYVDAGVPDGVQVDANGNVYSGCGDGIQVWNPQGTLLGKFFIGSTVAEMIFAGDGRLVILDETALYLANIAARYSSVAYP